MIGADVRATLFVAGSAIMATTIRPVATEEDLLRMPEDGRKRELVDGQIRMSPAGSRHGRVCVSLSSRLHTFIVEARLGYVFDSSTGFRLPGGNVRLPDVAFVAKGRFADERIPEGFSDVPPDLAIEVLSPDDRSRDVLDKVGEYLQAGVPLVWVIDPKRRTAAVYRSSTDVRHLGPDDLLDGEDVLPGFRCRLADVID
jgi:Uma2 family endonuclease